MCEAEYISLPAACQEISYLVQLLKDVLSHDFEPAALMNDNQGAIALVKNPIGHMRLKHIDIRYYYVRECFQRNCITLKYVLSNENFSSWLGIQVLPVLRMENSQTVIYVLTFQPPSYKKGNSDQTRI